ncbi:MAG TPA: hypothetical protein VGN68_12725 [Sphingopyxis sp.]|uniref:hypothetical protein n=1 Tax=Sphingopyxis sp. TaxID=1908224 RepID=UPI002E142F53|nr:hypothetical protein [Sphingopyxis sp.]
MAENKFSEWVDRHEPAQSRLLPITHVTSTISAERIIDENKMSLPEKCDGEFKDPLLYFFYGRPAYRLRPGSSISLEAACPSCFIFNPRMIDRCHYIHAFDTGAYFNRMYSHVLTEDFRVDDFSLEADPARINRLISATFEDEEAYLDADRSKLRKIDDVTQPWELQGRAYLTLLASPGRNEPDDRICSIEVGFRDPILLDENLLGVVVPHTLWMGNSKAPILMALADKGVKIGTYRFIVGRHPEYLQAQMEISVRNLLDSMGCFNHE